MTLINNNNKHHHHHHHHLNELQTRNNNVIKIELPGYNYNERDKIIFLNRNKNNSCNSDGADGGGVNNNDENGFDTTLPIELQPFFNSPNEFKTIIKSINSYKPKSITTFTILITLHLVILIPFLFILIFFGISKEHYQSNRTPFYVAIVLVFILLVSVIVMIFVRSNYIKNDIELYHSHLTDRYSIRGLEFYCILELKKRKFYNAFKVVFQSQLIIKYPQKIVNNNNNNNNNINNNNTEIQIDIAPQISNLPNFIIINDNESEVSKRNQSTIITLEKVNQP